MNAPEVRPASICCRPERAPIAMHWFQHEGEPNFLDSCRMIIRHAGGTEVDVSRFIGEVRARLRKAQRGDLRPASHIKGPLELVSNIDLFELRWTFTFGVENDRDILVRSYHAEPSSLGAVAILLWVHEKVTTPEDQVRKMQDAEIRKAEARYWEGKTADWGFVS